MSNCYYWLLKQMIHWGYSIVWRWIWNLFHELDKIFIFSRVQSASANFKKQFLSHNFLFITFSLVRCGWPLIRDGLFYFCISWYRSWIFGVMIVQIWSKCLLTVTQSKFYLCSWTCEMCNLMILLSILIEKNPRFYGVFCFLLWFQF